MADHQLSLTCTDIDNALISSDYYFQYVCDPSEGDQGIAGNGNSLKDLIDTIGATKNATIHLLHHPQDGDTTTYTVNTPETVPNNIHINVMSGAILDGAGTLTINGGLTAGKHKIFGSTITVVFGNGCVEGLFPEWWGAVADGTTDNVTALQDTLDSAYDNNLPILLGPGKYKTSKLDYAGQSIIGVPGSGIYTATVYSTEMSILLGVDSEDILNYSVDSPADSNIFKRGTIIENLLFIVDDTTDASGSFSRGGAGNAAIALDHADGSVNSPTSTDNMTFIRSRFQNVAIIGLSMASNGQNNSVGIWQEGLIYDVTFDQLYIARCEYGFWGSYPAANVTSIEFAPDSLKFESCLIECKNPLRIYNSFASSINNMQVYGSATDDKGISLRDVTSNVRSGGFFWNITNLYQEIGNVSGTGEIGVIEGRDHIFTGGVLINSLTEQYYTWSADYCQVSGMRINNKAANASLVISGGNNKFTNIVTSLANRDWVSDTGIGNRVDSVDTAILGVDRKTTRLVTENFSRNTYPALAQTSHFAQYSPDHPYYGNEDMFFWPSDLHWVMVGGTQPVITKDSTLGGSGEYATMPTPGGQNYFTLVNRLTLRLGYNIPITKVRIYAMVKNASSNTTQNWNIDVDSIEIDDADLSTTTSWSVVWFDADLSGLAKGATTRIRVGAPTANQEWYLAWIAIVPWKTHSIQHYIEGLERSSSPPEPAEGTFVIWMSDGGGKGDDGDIMIASKAGGTTNYGTLFNHSGGSSW